MVSQMSAQLRSVVMHRRSSATISSPRHASAQAVHPCAHSKHASNEYVRHCVKNAVADGDVDAIDTMVAEATKAIERLVKA